MTQENAGARPLRLIDVLEAEFEFLHHPLPAATPGADADSSGEERPDGYQEQLDLQREIHLRQCIHDLPHGEKRAALCLSGGGVRSATFSLGVIQALARLGWLQQFHYMSSVSGGGYIASWLSSWIAREGGDSAAVIGQIAGERGRPTTHAMPEPAQVTRLRANSNYLTPVHGASIDLMTLAATFARNLVLHWTVLLPLLAGLIMLPRLHFSGVVWFLKNTATGPLYITLGLSLALGMLGFVNILRNLPGYGRTHAKSKGFICWCYLPILVATIALGCIVPWLGEKLDDGWQNCLIFAACGAGILVACKSVAIVLQENDGDGLRPSQPGRPDGTAGTPGPDRAGPADDMDGTGHQHRWHRWKARFRGMPSLTFAGAVSGLLLLAIANSADRRAFPGDTVAEGFGFASVYAIAGVPALLAALWICMTLHVGLSGPANTHEDEREWWARASAYIFGTILAWLMASFVVLLGPWLVLYVEWGGEAAGSAGLLGMATGAYGFWSKNGSAAQRKLKSAASMLGDRLFDAAAAAFIIMLVIAISYTMSLLPLAWTANAGVAWNAQQYVDLTTGAPAWGMGLLMAGLLGLALVLSHFIGVNAFSLHSMYGNRLVRAYLGASNSKRDPDPFTGFDRGDNLPMRALHAAMTSRERSTRRLFHILNLSLNLVKPSNKRLEWQQRKAACYTVSPLHAGAACTGFQPAATYTGEDGISLARAMTISGAAATPNMGYHTSTLIAFAMTFFNIRLGWWLPNPGQAGEKFWGHREPTKTMSALVHESLASTSDENEYVYLSDGGHFENLGLYEMVRRRCRHIVVVDAGCDPKYQFDDLENAVRKIRIDLGISIVFPRGLPTRAWSRGDANQHQHSTVATIRYSDIDGSGSDGEPNDGVLIYIKPVLSGDEPLDVTRFAALAKSKQHNPFPHHPTSDQFFDEVRFESYRALGYHSVMADRILRRGAGAGDAWPAADSGAVDASDAELAAAEASSEHTEPAGDANAVVPLLGAAGMMGLGAVAIPAVLALGLAALLALSQARPQHAVTGSVAMVVKPGAQAPGTVVLDAGKLQEQLDKRFPELLAATEALERSVSKANITSASTVSEMHALLKEEIALMKASRGSDNAAPVVTLDVLLKFRQALKDDHVVVADPYAPLMFMALEQTRVLLEEAQLGKRLQNVEDGVNRLNPRANVRAVVGERK